MHRVQIGQNRHNNIDRRVKKCGYGDIGDESWTINRRRKMRQGRDGIPPHHNRHVIALKASSDVIYHEWNENIVSRKRNKSE